MILLLELLCLLFSSTKGAVNAVNSVKIWTIVHYENEVSIEQYLLSQATQSKTKFVLVKGSFSVFDQARLDISGG